MKNYRDYDVHDLSQDASFRQWVLNSSVEEAAFWDNWLHENPDRADTVEQARDFLLAVQQQYQSTVSEEEVNEGVHRLVSQVRSDQLTATGTEVPIIPLRSRSLGWVRWAAAAILIVGVGLAWQLTRPEPASIASGPSVATPSAWVSRVNSGRTPLPILLEDGSVVTLEPGTTLQYPRRFAAAQRAVTLTGEAFFEVAPRPSQPFVVTTADFTTTVLGTSFRVRSSSPDHKAFVVVRSGKVAVQARNQAGTSVVEATKPPVILVRNEQVVADKQSDQSLAKSVVQDEQLASNELNKEQVFDDVPVATVFSALEKQYGVTIQFDRAVLSRCLVNTAFDQENLRERLSAVCQAVGATYQITDNQIRISSTGCTL